MSQMPISQAHLVMVKVQGELWPCASGHVDEFGSEPPRTLPDTPIGCISPEPPLDWALYGGGVPT